VPTPSADKVKMLNTFWPPTRVRFQNTHHYGENHTYIQSHSNSTGIKHISLRQNNIEGKIIDGYVAMFKR
jgi:hypothetical protein